MNSAPSPSALDALTNLMMQVHRIVRQRNAATMRGVGVSILQLHGLLVMREHPGMTMKELAAQLSVSSPSATVFVARLEEQGLVLRTHDQANRKIVRVTLTPEGQRLATKAFRHFEDSFRSLFGILPHAEQQQLAHIFDHLIRLHSMNSDA
jgi:MarR family transcriptional regulator, 2-MHQ and catechol-resistance regulon repressor